MVNTKALAEKLLGMYGRPFVPTDVVELAQRTLVLVRENQNLESNYELAIEQRDFALGAGERTAGALAAVRANYRDLAAENAHLKAEVGRLRTALGTVVEMSGSRTVPVPDPHPAGFGAIYCCAHDALDEG